MFKKILSLEDINEMGYETFEEYADAQAEAYEAKWEEERCDDRWKD